MCIRDRDDAPEIDANVLFVSERELHPGDFASVKIIDATDEGLVGQAVWEESR